MQTFFASDVDFSTSEPASLDQVSDRASRRWLETGIAAAAVAVSGLLTLYHPPAHFSELEIDPAAVYGTAAGTPKHVPISAADRLAAARLQASFVEVPPSDADREISPDYDL